MAYKPMWPSAKLDKINKSNIDLAVAYKGNRCMHSMNRGFYFYFQTG